MHPDKVVYITDPKSVKEKLLHWAASFSTACYFDSNNYTDDYSVFDVLVAAGVKKEVKATAGNAFDQLSIFLRGSKKIIPGFLAYDLKNETENLRSVNPDHLHFPDLYFFEPQHHILIKDRRVSIYSEEADLIWESVNAVQLNQSAEKGFEVKINHRFSMAEYKDTVLLLQQHIQRGNIYEVNFCQEFYAEDVHLNPVELFLKLNRASPVPFANFFKQDDKFIISATPERFLSKRGSKLISQPIKGTARRQPDPAADEDVKNYLKNNEKERAENVMIVDLVRNDLTKSAVPGSVKVEELFGIYSFSTVHQMVSTITCVANSKLDNTQLLKNTFPMGSMTGAPKIKAMELIDEYERSKRGIFSGAVGYFSADGDFDFNVVIRSILYNEANGYLSFQVGSAITSGSDPQSEYDECLLKAEAILSVLDNKS